MKMPDQLSQFLTPAQWDSLGLHELEAEDRRCVLELLLHTFEGETPGKIDPKDLAEALRHVQGLADDFRICADVDTSVSRDQSIAADHAAGEVLRELQQDRKKQQEKP